VNERLTPFGGGSKVIYRNPQRVYRIPGFSSGAVSRKYEKFLTVPHFKRRNLYEICLSCGVPSRTKRRIQRFFPDIKHGATQGETLAECIEMAEDIESF